MHSQLFMILVQSAVNMFKKFLKIMSDQIIVAT